MSAEPEVIDLDGRPPAESAGAAARSAIRRKTVLRLVAAFVAGVVLGGVGVSQLRDSREQRERLAAVSLVAFPDSVRDGTANGNGVLKLNGQLTVINAGPVPVTIRAASGHGTGVQVRDTGRSPVLRPGGTGSIDIEVHLDCATAFGDEPLSMRFSVETDDEMITEVSYPIATRGSIWHSHSRLWCADTRFPDGDGAEN
ncbi:hypothetical protein C1I95_25455 [Micromonospora craterilacus]|uniref:Uncharacterized protein n=1 Tax=Micromonospora craterilacus TaxID=1655439 RepID=A0A2W2EJX3_9ACTN|nr:hypothetical protein [Micromonospora craterilacus]PZG12578.1 hypothetical protein C1I95_25455 [Micromonospora craterilacus]